MIINLEKKYFFYKLSKMVKNSKQKIIFKHGWIIKLTNEAKNKIGYGEISPLFQKDFAECQFQLKKIQNKSREIELIKNIKELHPCIQSGINIALAELKNEISFNERYEFEEIDQTAILLDSDSILKELKLLMSKNKLNKKSFTLKWKVAIKDNKCEEGVLENILNQINNTTRLRIDANGSWNREIANRWADILRYNKNIDWLEQPLHEDDIEGLKELQKKIPVALDESLRKYPNLINDWHGWQIRRPSQESNPIALLKELQNKKGFRSISTSFETGIGRRMLYHLASIQLKGPTPKVPGLALNQTPKNFIFSNNVKTIWEKL